MVKVGTNGSIITGGKGTDQISLDVGVDEVVLGNVTAADIDTIIGMTKIDTLAFHDIGVATKVVDVNFNGMDTTNDVLATFTAGVPHAIEVDNAYVFTFRCETYVLIDGANAGYSANDEAVVHLFGVTADDVIAMGDIFTAAV